MCYYAFMKRKRGGQPSNQNARKHGLYSGDLSPGQVSEFWRIVTTEKIDPQSAIMRIKLRLLLQQEPVNPRVLKDAARLMARLALSKAEGWKASASTLSKADTQEMSRLFFAVLERQIPRRPEYLNT